MKTILVKIGGEVAETKNTAKTLLEDLITLKQEGHRVILCHGGGPQITKELKSSGVETKFVDGQRVTDADTLKITCKILLGEINPSLVAMCNSNGFHAVGMSGLDAGLYQAKQKNPSLGYVGQIEKINLKQIENVLSQGFIPVVACIGAGTDGQMYNINADSAAGELAAALKADQYLVFTNVEGLYRSFPDKGSLISEISGNELQDMLTGSILTEGMIPKAQSIITALKGAVKSAAIIDGRKEHAVLNTVKNMADSKPIYGTVIKK